MSLFIVTKSFGWEYHNSLCLGFGDANVVLLMELDQP